MTFVFAPFRIKEPDYFSQSFFSSFFLFFFKIFWNATKFLNKFVQLNEEEEEFIYLKIHTKCQGTKWYVFQKGQEKSFSARLVPAL